MYQERIQQNQKFLLRLLNLHIGHYYPLRKWIGIAYKGKIDEVSHLSIGYNTKYFKKGKKWYKQQTREYQHPDLGYKLNLVLDRIPQLVLLPALLQPAFRLASLLLFSLTTTTYQPTTADTWINAYNPTTNYGTSANLNLINWSPYIYRSLFYFDISDIPNQATFTQGDFTVCMSSDVDFTTTIAVYRLTKSNWTETGATWNKYDGTNAWTTAGGDYTTTNGVSMSCSIPNTSTPPPWTFSAPALIQDCYNTFNKQVHLIMLEPNSCLYGMDYFPSREYTTDLTKRPKLTVTYVTLLQDFSQIALSSFLRPYGEQLDSSSFSLSANLEPNRWKKDTTHSQIWIKEETHNEIYKS